MAVEGSRIAVFPGSFDPVTYGHLDLIRRSAQLVDRLIVAVLHNTSKQAMFSIEERKAMLIEATSGYPHVEVDSFDGLLVDYLQQRNARLLLRGLRTISDFETETQMAALNQHLAPGIETVFLLSHPQNSFLSSSMLKEILRLDGDISQFVPFAVLNCIVMRKPSPFVLSPGKKKS